MLEKHNLTSMPRTGAFCGDLQLYGIEVNVRIRLTIMLYRLYIDKWRTLVLVVFITLAYRLNLNIVQKFIYFSNST